MDTHYLYKIVFKIIKNEMLYETSASKGGSFHSYFPDELAPLIKL